MREDYIIQQWLLSHDAKFTDNIEKTVFIVVAQSMLKDIDSVVTGESVDIDYFALLDIIYKVFDLVIRQLIEKSNKLMEELDKQIRYGQQMTIKLIGDDLKI